MHERQHSFHSGVPGMTYGFMEALHGGRRALTHEGNMAGFGALLYLVPELDLGLFVAVNGGSDECESLVAAYRPG